MQIIVNLLDGTELHFTFGAANAIDKMVEALKENCDDWTSMVITIVNQPK